jgi:hypothetical protein
MRWRCIGPTDWLTVYHAREGTAPAKKEAPKPWLGAVGAEGLLGGAMTGCRPQSTYARPIGRSSEASNSTKPVNKKAPARGRGRTTCRAPQDAARFQSMRIGKTRKGRRAFGRPRA